MMKHCYLLDTNICVFLFRGKHQMNQKISSVGWHNCYISEVTVAELQYGVECSSQPQENQLILDEFLQQITVIPFSVAVKQYAQAKAKLRKKGLLVDDFDLLIGCTAISGDMTLVTDNLKHFDRIQGLKIENWVER